MGAADDRDEVAGGAASGLCRAAHRTGMRTGAGDVLVIKAGEVHSFRGVGDARLVSVDVHLSPTFVTEWVPHPGLTTHA
jgi:hypothetical protein